METIRMLCEIISKQKVKKIDVFGPKQNKKLLVNKLYDGIVSGNIYSNEDAMQILYGQKGSQKNMLAVKRRLEEKLINTLFFIDLKSSSQDAYNHSQVKNYLSFSVVKILKSQNKFHASARIAEKTLMKALQYDMIDLSYLLTIDLSQYYTILQYDKSKSKYFMALDAKLSRSFQEEQTARRCFIFFAAYINQNKVFEEDAIPDYVKKEMAKLKSMLKGNKNYDFNFYAFNALFFISYLRKDLASMEKISKKAISFFNSKTEFPQLGKFSFVQKLGFIYEQQRKHQKAIDTYEIAFGFELTEGGTSWFNVRSHLFDANLALRNYRDCYKFLSEAISHKSFKSLFSNYKEPWLIREAYINFLIEAGKVDIQIMKQHQLRSFSISRFVNDVVMFSKDKRGLNISVLIIQSLFLLLREDYDGFERKLDSLNQYAFRYLKNDATLRSNAFIKILQKLPDVSYHPVRWVSHTEKLIKRMKSAKTTSSFDTKEKEIMSYEIIHEVLLEILEKQKVYA